MDILVNVANQTIKLVTNLHSLVEGTQEFVRFVFDLSDEWDDLTVFAQFTQNGESYNQFLDNNNCVFLPAEIVAGECTMMLYGSGETVIGTTNYLTLTINESILVSDAHSTVITESLYNQLVDRVEEFDELKQDILVSGTNIKTINNQSVLGSGNIEISGGSGDVSDVTVDGVSVVEDGVASIDLLGKVSTSSIGEANGIVPLDANSLVDEQYLPSYVDDVIEGYYYEGSFYEDSAHTTTITGETGKIYIDLTESKSYRWSGTVFVEITSGGHIYTAGSGIDISSGDVISSENSNLVNGSASGSFRGIDTKEEDGNYTIGSYAFAEGLGTKASGGGAHAEGHNTEASGYYSHAEGCGFGPGDSGSIASSYCSHAEGCGTTAAGYYSHSQNYGTKALTKSQTVIGEYNKLDTVTSSNSRGDYAFAIGNGTANTDRSNAFTVEWDGDVSAAGNMNIASGKHYKINGTNLSASDVGAQPTLVSGTNIKTINSQSLLGSGDIDITEIGSEEFHTQSDTITGAINELNDRTGQVVSSVQSSDVTLPDQTRKITTSISLPTGTWLIVGYQSFAYLNNTGGRRWLAITDNGTEGVIANVQYAPASSGATAINITCITSNNTGSNKTINLVAWQATATSGSLTASSGKIQAIRIC